MVKKKPSEDGAIGSREDVAFRVIGADGQTHELSYSSPRPADDHYEMALLDTLPWFECGQPTRNRMLHEIDFYDEEEQIWGQQWGAEGIGKLREVLVSRPTENETRPEYAEEWQYYYSSAAGNADLGLLRAQFDQYYDVLEQNGVRVNYIEPPVPMISAYGYIKNLVTMAGGGLVVRGGAIIHRMGLGSWQRGREVIWSKALAALQVPIYLTIHGTGVGELGAGNKDWQPQRIGADPPIGAVDLTDQTSLRVLSACGIPSALVAIAPGTAAREAFRRFLHVTVAPLLNIVAAECREKLNVDDLTFDTTDLHAADVAGRARAFQSLVGGGMGLDQAAGLSGLLIGDD